MHKRTVTIAGCLVLVNKVGRSRFFQPSAALYKPITPSVVSGVFVNESWALFWDTVYIRYVGLYYSYKERATLDYIIHLSGLIRYMLSNFLLYRPACIFVSSVVILSSFSLISCLCQPPEVVRCSIAWGSITYLSYMYHHSDEWNDWRRAMWIHTRSGARTPRVAVTPCRPHTARKYVCTW